MNLRIAPAYAPDSPVSPAAPLPAAVSESAGAVVSAAVAPAAPAVEAASAPASAPAAVEAAPAPAPAPVESAPIPDAVREFKPSLLETPTDATPETPAPEAAKPDAKPAEAAKPEDKPAEAPKPEEKAAEPALAEPIAYEFKFPENIDKAAIDKPVLEKYTSILNKARVPPEVAQEALDLHLEQVQSIGKRLADVQWDVFNRQQEAWQSDVKSDPELGGARMKTTIRNAARFVEGMLPDPVQRQGFMDAMKTTGAGNYKEIVRALARAGDRFFKEGEARNMPPARQAPLTREQKQAARYSK